VLHRPRFAHRREAGQVLAQVLQALGLQHPTVLALPRGGVPVAVEVARVLGVPLDLLMVRKIGAPGQPELAVAAMAALGTGAADSGDERSGPPAQTFVDPALMAATACGLFESGSYAGGGIAPATRRALDTQFVGVPHTGMVYTPPGYSDHIAVSLTEDGSFAYN
jgi:hypothetical protein